MTKKGMVDWRVGMPRVLEYSSATGVVCTTRVVNYSSIFLLLEYSLISISGCKFPFPVTVFLHSVDNFIPIRATCRPCGTKNLKISLELLKYRCFALRDAADDSIDADRPVHHPFLRHWQLVLKYFRY